MDLMTLAAKIELDDEGFRKGVKNAEGMGQKLAGKMSASAVAVGNIMADMLKKGVDAIGNVVSGAIDGFADYQQLIGGVETLFKESAGRVQKYAEQSYRTTGLSANQYMETVTSFSASLLQGLGGDTAEAADMADMAITDMADNANKMGTDISSIQAAYQGFAKQNYTMLDNLKLGYGGTASEMVRLINDSGILEDEITDLDGITFDQLVMAIHKVQTEMGITGTTAKEAADTLSGSRATMESAWNDFLAAIGGAGDEKKLDEAMTKFKESFATYMQNFIPQLVQTIGNSGNLVTAIAESIADLPTDLLAQVAEKGLGAGAEMVGGISKITTWVIDNITTMFKRASINTEEVAKFGEAIGNFIGTAINDIVTNAPAIITGIFNVGVSLAGSLVEGLFSGLLGDSGFEVDKIADALAEGIEDAEFKATKAGGILAYMQSLHDKFGDAVKGTEEWKQATEELEKVMPGASEVFKNYGKDIDGAIKHLDKLNEKIRETAINTALQNALADSYALLAQQNIEYRRQEAKYNRNQSLMEYAQQKAADVIKDNAAAAAEKYWNETHDENGNETGLFMQESYDELMRMAQGKATYNGEEVDLGDVDMDTLHEIAQSLEDVSGLKDIASQIDDEKKVWEEAKLDMEAAKADMEATAKEIEATKAEIEDVKVAVAQSAIDLNSDFSILEGSVTSGGDLVYGALDKVAARIAGVRFKDGVIYMPKATGIDFVPYNGFKAELHKGETVLTRAEAERYRRGEGSSEVVGAIQSMRGDLQNMKLVVGQKTFGRAVVDYGGSRVSNYIGQADSRRYSGYGT